MNIGSIYSSPASYLRSSCAVKSTARESVMDVGNFVSKYSGNKNDTVTQSSSYVYCHRADQEYDTSLDNSKILFGRYYEDGSSLQIYKSKEYTNENPLMDIYTRNPDGEWNKQTVNAKEINLENCSFAEMRVDCDLKSPIKRIDCELFTCGLCVFQIILYRQNLNMKGLIL